jgi:hypothetical protein
VDNDMSAKAEESPLLKSVTRKRLVKADCEDLAYDLVIYKVWKSVMCAVIKCSHELCVKVVRNPFTNLNPIYRGTHSDRHSIYGRMTVQHGTN